MISEETRAKLSAARLGKKLSEDAKAKLRGRKHSEETLAKLRGGVESIAKRLEPK